MTLLVSKLVVVYQTTSRSFFAPSTTLESVPLCDHERGGSQKSAAMKKEKNAIRFDLLIGMRLPWLGMTLHNRSFVQPIHFLDFLSMENIACIASGEFG